MPEPSATSRSSSTTADGLVPDGRIPIVLGVTGHRTLARDDIQAIEAELRALIARVRREAPHSPIVVLSALAEGADQLVARVALAEGATLIAVLPMPLENYEHDFPEQKSRDEFRAMLLDPRTERVIVAPPLDDAAGEPGDARDHQYLLAGLFVARNSDVLLALWDGEGSRGTGGSAQIVEFRRTGRLDATDWVRLVVALASDSFHLSNAPLDAPESGLVYHIPVRRHDDAPAPSQSANWLVPERFQTSPRRREKFVRAGLATLRHRDELNREGYACRESRGGRLATSAAMLTRGEVTPFARDPRAPAALAGLRATFAIADSLAVEHQTRVYRTMIALFGMIAIATIALILRNLAITDEAKRIYLGTYLLLLTIADLFYLRTRVKHSQDRFQDYRAIAEGLRVQFFWRLAGSASAVSDYYLRKQRSELRWIRDVLRVSALRTPWAATGDFAAVQRLWVKDQRAYYDRAAHRDGMRRRRQRVIGSALVLLSLGATINWLWGHGRGPTVYLVIAVLAGLVLLCHTAYEIWNATGEAESPTQRSVRDMLALGTLSAFVAGALYALLVYGGSRITSYEPGLAMSDAPFEWMLAAIGITALIGTFAHAYANVRAFGEHQKQYERMAELFQSADDALDRAAKSTEPEASKRVIFDLGSEALAEHADWLLLHRARPIELPTADI